MGDYNAISNVCDFLAKLMWNSMKEDPKAKSIITSDEEISMASPKECEYGGSTKKLSVFLYNLVPTVDKGPPAKAGAGGTKQVPKGSNFEFHILFTPNTQNRSSDHALLSKVIQILDEHPIVKPTGGKTEYMAIMEPLTIDDLSELWELFDLPYKLSVSYKLVPIISVVTVQATPQKSAKATPPKSKVPKKK